MEDREQLGVIGTGTAKKAEEEIKKRKKKQKSRLDSIMGEIRKGRPQVPTQKPKKPAQQ